LAEEVPASFFLIVIRKEEIVSGIPLEISSLL